MTKSKFGCFDLNVVFVVVVGGVGFSIQIKREKIENDPIRGGGHFLMPVSGGGWEITPHP